MCRLTWKYFFWNGLRGAVEELSNRGEDGVPEVSPRGDQGARVEEAGEAECADRGAQSGRDNLTGFSSGFVLFFMSPKARASSEGFLVVIGEAPKDSGLRCGLWDSSSEGEDLLIELEGLENL